MLQALWIRKASNTQTSCLAITALSQLLDVGCCMGTDLRMLIKLDHDKSRLTGVELLEDFLKLGFEFFQDGNDSATRSIFTTGDFLNPEFRSSDLGSQLIAKQFDAVYTGSILHLFNQEQIVLLLRNIRACMRDGGVFFGRTTGLAVAGDHIYPESGSTLYLHSVESLQSLLSLEFGSAAVVTRVEEPTFCQLLTQLAGTRILIQFHVINNTSLEIK